MDFNEVFIDEPRKDYIQLQNQIIDLLSNNNYSISEARGLFYSIIKTLERFMVINNY